MYIKTISLEITKEKHKCFQREETREQHLQKMESEGVC